VWNLQKKKAKKSSYDGSPRREKTLIVGLKDRPSRDLEKAGGT